MGTIIFPEAALKVFLQASPKVRAERRANQLKEKGMSVIMHDLLELIQQRDEEDINRKISPLKPADDSLIIDTSYLSIQKVEEKVMEKYKKL
jgi:cytidylate kinase